MTRDETIELAKRAWADSGEGWTADAWFRDRAACFERFVELLSERQRAQAAPSGGLGGLGKGAGAGEGRRGVRGLFRCVSEQCGHEQVIFGLIDNSGTYFGSGASFCNKCDGPVRQQVAVQ